MRACLGILMLVLTVAGCARVVPPPTAPAAPPPDAATAERARMAVENFLQVVDRVEPVAEDLCRAELGPRACDFRILVTRDPEAGVNAFQTVNRRGEPLIIFTLGLIAEARNTDELAFVMGHEAGHHIAQHIQQQQVLAAEGARVFTQIARDQGAPRSVQREAAELGSLVASRRFSQAAELEADAIGTAIALRAGFDPLRGAAFFERIPDPGAAFLSTHPPNALRSNVVRQVVASVTSGD